MSAITDIYDALSTHISGVLSTHKELNNPYKIENDAVLTYNAAWGLAYGSGLNIDGNPNSGNEQRQRDFEIILTRRNFGTARDGATRESTAKAIMEDWTLVTNELAENPRLGNPSLVQRVVYSSDEGISFLTLDQERNGIFVLRTTIEVVYEEIVVAPGC